MFRKNAVFQLALAAVLALFFAAQAAAASAYDEVFAAYSRGDYKKAIVLLKDYTKKTPSADAYYMLGYSSYKIGKYEAARRYFSEAYLIDPEFNPGKIKPEAGKGGACPAGNAGG